MRTSLSDALTGALAFVLPVACAGCGAPDVPLCPPCAACLVPAVSLRHLGGLPVASGLVFDGPAAQALRGLKEEGRTALARALAPALRAASARFTAEPVDVVAVPSTSAALRRRGYRPAELLARRAGLCPRRLLRVVRATEDQRGLGRAARAENVAGSMRAARAAGRRILLVDDVVTTGATLGEAARALRAAGAEVVGAATVAATARHGPRRSDTSAIPR